MALNTIPNKGLTSRGYPSDRLVTPIIINGDMSVAQRGTSATGKTADGYYTTDRWNHSINLGTWSIDQSTDIPTGQGFAKSHKMTCTTGGSTSAGTQTYFNTRLEGQNLQMLKKGTSNAESLTLSFWGKSATTTGTMTVELFDTDNSRQISKQISLTTSWTKYTINYDADTTGTLNNDNGASLYVIFWVSAGSNFTSGTLSETWTSNTNANRAVGQTNFAVTNTELYFTGVQLEVGEFDSTTIPSFPFESFDNNLRKCQRYYHQIGYGLNGAGGTVNAGQGQWYNSSEVTLTVYFPTSMRATPSMTSPTVSSGYRFHSAGSFVDASDGGSINSPSNMMTGIFKNGLSGGSGGQASFLAMIASGASYKFDAEL
jgi:hypothetical protein